MRSGPPVGWRALLHLLVIGRGAEFVRAAIEDEYEERNREGRFDTKGWYRRQVLGSIRAWWSASAVRERRKATRSGAAGAPVGTRTGWGWTMGSLLSDVRYTFRGLRRRPTFALVVVVTLGLGIGAATTIFSVVDGVLLRPLDYDDPESLVVAGTTPFDRYDGPLADERETYRMMGSSVGNIIDWAARTRSLESLAAVEWMALRVSTPQGPDLISTARVSDAFFETMRVAPALGRLFDSDEYTETRRVVVLSHGAWVRRYGADPNVVGTTLRARATNTIAGTAAEDAWLIVGVLPEDFEGPAALNLSSTDAWVPLDTADPRYTDRGGRSATTVGRLAPGVSLTTARADLWKVMQQVIREHPEGNGSTERGWFGAGINTLHQTTVGNIGPTFAILLASVGFLLLIACANVANLFLARGMDRVHELGLRMALGAGRGRVSRQLLTESVVLAVLGGSFGVLLSYGGVAAFLRLAPGSVPRTGDVAVDLRILAFALVVSIVTGVLFGAGPALQLTRDRKGAALRASDHAGPAGSRIRSALVSFEIALALILTVGGGLLFNSFVRLRNVDPGFDPSGVMTMNVRAPGGFAGADENPEAVVAFWTRIEGALNNVPGVRSIGLASNIPSQSTNWRPGVLLEGETEEYGRGVDAFVVAPGFFETLEIDVQRGRALTRADVVGSPYVVVVNEAFVEEYLADTDGVGEVVRMSGIGAGDERTALEVVGVVANFRQARTDTPPAPQIFVSYAQTAWPSINIMARTDGGPLTVADGVKRALRDLDPEMAITGERTLEDRLAAFLVRPRFYALLILGFSIVALAIAAAGVYGTMSYAVGRRTKELGIRLALGAEHAQVRSLVLRRGLLATTVGVVLGLAGAWGLARFLGDLLYEVEPTDGATFTGVTLVLVLVATMASWLPAQRATRVDPLVTLKAE